ncbi:MAG: flagellar export chaperone FlgN [Deltaproteobacteria bacterium]|nr:flagellar export chaperone FlgN [Deltaproteobacteria bacterium]
MSQSQSKTWESWSAIVLTLIADVEQLMAAFKVLPDNIQKEHAAALSRDIEALEHVGQEKQKIASQIKQAYAKLGDSIRASFGGELRNLSDCLKAVAKEASVLNTLQPKNDNYQKLLQRFETKVHRMVALSQEVRPHMERNKLVLDRLLSFQRQSLQFWTDLVRERSSFYGAKGKKVSVDTAIQLNVEV